MKRVLLITLVLLSTSALARAGGLEVGKAGAAFDLVTPSGKKISLKGLLAVEDTKAVLVEFAGLGCPFTRGADRRLVPLATRHAPEGLQVVALFPNGADNRVSVNAYAVRIRAPYLVARDPGAATATAWGVRVTPTFFLFDSTGTLRFRGSQTGLAEAVASVLAGTKVVKATSPEVGVDISPKAKDPAVEANLPDPSKAMTKVPVPELSEAAEKWLGVLVGKLRTGDLIVARSARAGILSIGPSALPHLRRVRQTAEGRFAGLLDDAIREITNPARGGVRSARGGAGGPKGSASMLETQIRAIVRYIGITQEQAKQIRVGFVELQPIEEKIRDDARAGRRENLPDRRRALVQKSQEIVKRVLTAEQWERWESMRRKAGQRSRPEAGAATEPEGGKDAGGGKR